jgi:HTH-type transcriptional regulator/antitoxin HigA
MMDVRLKVIETEAEYESALADFGRFFDAADGSREGEVRDVLAVLIKEYEDGKYPIVAPSPVAAIEFRMEQAGLSRKDLIPCLGSKSRVSEVLSGKRALSLSMIRELNRRLGIPYESLMRDAPTPVRMEAGDLDWSRFPIREMERNGAFNGFRADSGGLGAYREEALRWLADRAGGMVAMHAAAFRKTDDMRVKANLDPYALLGWSLQALAEVRQEPPSVAFDPSFLTGSFLKGLVSLSVMDEGPRLAAEYLAKAGIVLRVLPHLKRTYLDGAVFLVDGRYPAIVLTLRYDRLDNFWFVLLHETAHVVKGHLSAESAYIADDLKQDPGNSEKEREADAFASGVLLPSDFDSSAGAFATPREIVDYARRVGVHPAIVAGRIQHDRRDYSVFSSLVGRGAVRTLFSGYGLRWSSVSDKE